jgi:hypothetical protein
MQHDKIKAAARKRMAETGESYAAARREVIREHEAVGGEAPLPGTRRFAISYSESWLATLLTVGLRLRPEASGVEVDSDEIRVWMPGFKLGVPRNSVRSAARSQTRRARGTTGVHVRRGQLLVNGSADGLVELTIEPPCHTDRTLSTMFVKEKVSSVIVSLVDPDGFIAVVEGDGHT